MWSQENDEANYQNKLKSLLFGLNRILPREIVYNSIEQMCYNSINELVKPNNLLRERSSKD